MHEGDDVTQPHDGAVAITDAERAERDNVTARGVARAATAVAGDGGAAPAGAGPQVERGPFGLGSRLTWILAVCCVAQFMVILDLSIVNVALPSIQSSLDFSSAGLQWVVDAYAITFAGFLMLGGRVADAFGHRRTFVSALALFAATSLAGGLAPTSTFLVVARGMQGFACAFMAATSLAIITASFPPGPRLHRAIGLWAAMNGLGGAAGVLFGGIITEAISWRWTLLINPPIGIVAALVAWQVVSERRRARDVSAFDIPGAVSLTLGQMVLVFGVVKAGTDGWHSAAALGPIIAGIALLGLFGVVETRVAKEPLVPFKDLTKPLNVANGIVLLFSAALFPMWFVSSLYLQQVIGLSPLHTGLTFLPMALTIMLVASRAGRLVSRFGVRPVLLGGLCMLTTGLLLLSKVAASGSSVLYVMLPGIITAAGIGLSIVSSTIAATQGAKEGQAGLASGLVNTSRQVGGGIGLALLITLATQYTSHEIGKGHPVPQALTDGFRLAYLIAAGFAAAAALVTLAAVAKPEGTVARRLPIGAAVAGVIALFVALDFAVADGSHGAPIGKYTTKDTYAFVTEPGLHPPIARADVVPDDLGQLDPGYIFLANFYNLSYPPLTGQSGPLILDQKLAPVWFHPVPENVVASNLSLQTWQGKPALAWWQGVITNAGATTSGEYVVVNQHYQPVARLQGKDGWVLTLHEFLIRGDHAWVTANKNLPMNLSRYGGTYNGALTDSAVQEYDLRTGKLLYTWDARDHIPLSDSRGTVPLNGFPWDAYHVNSIDLTGDGRMLVSMRDTWAAYLVDIPTGRIVWTLGGRHSSFAFGPRADFQWQHDVRLGPGSTATLFDDHCCQITGGGTYVSPTAPSRALTLKLDASAHTATLASQDGHGRGFDADYMGSSQRLSNGNTFVGWGSQPFFTEYSPSGKALLDVVLPGSDLSYRTSRQPWVGLPLTSPAGAARTQGGHTTVYASWNGATEVDSWRVLAGATPASLHAVTTASRSGFETAIAVPASARAFRLQALDTNGQVIGTSRPFTVPA
jgi:EmrB/QacA subfamily drug resistance transporter